MTKSTTTTPDSGSPVQRLVGQPVLDVLVACESSGTVREAFRRLGHRAWSYIVSGREARCHRLPPSKDRWKIRSKTYQGIADAMASQWALSLASNATNHMTNAATPSHNP